MSEVAYQEYRLFSQSDGRITGTCQTNDNLDRGYPTEFAEWPVEYRDYAHMAHRTGLSHVGISGVVVSVYLDGKQLDGPVAMNCSSHD